MSIAETLRKQGANIPTGFNYLPYDKSQSTRDIVTSFVVDNFDSSVHEDLVNNITKTILDVLNSYPSQCIREK